MRCRNSVVCLLRLFSIEICCLLTIFLYSSLPFQTDALAGISTDGSVGPAQTLSGPDFTIPETLGAVSGNNLFHSFNTFSIDRSQSATFTGSDSITNMISRVTGGNASSIDGLLCSQVGSAGFYFINPAGVVFGPNAEVDVPGAFHVSTADELQFADGNVFNATNTTESQLSTAKPEAFGFLSAQAASISINGTLLSFNPGSTVSISAGDIEITGADTSWGGVKAESGNIRIAAVGDTSVTVPLDGETGDVTGNLNMQGAAIVAYGNGGGDIRLDAGDANITDSRVHANNDGDMNAEENAGIHINVKNLDVIGSAVTSDAWSLGDSAPVRINARETVRIIDGGGVRSSVFDSGDSGGITIQADRLLIDGGGQEWSSIDLVDTDIITGIAAEVAYYASGNAGAVDIQVAQDTLIQNYSEISSLTFYSSLGDAASITLKTGELKIDGRDVFAGIASESWGNGKGGAIEIGVDGKFELSSSAFVSANSSDTGDCGKITISAGLLNMDNYAYITNQLDSTLSTGKSGTVSVTVEGMLEMNHNTYITSSTCGTENAGNVSVCANQIKMDGYSNITSEATYGSEGSGGDVLVKADGIIEMYNGANISSSVRGYSIDDDDGGGDGGNVTVNAGAIVMDAMDGVSYIASDTTNATGHAGTVKVTVDGTLEILNGASISSSSSCSEGNAGSVSVQANQLSMDGTGSTITSDAIGTVSDAHYSGNANSVNVITDETLEISNGAKISSNTFTAGNAGTVAVSAKEIRIDGMGTGISSEAAYSSTGFAGDIIVNADRITISNDGEISISHYGKLTTEQLESFQSGLLNIKADLAELTGGSEISASSMHNVPASNIFLTIKDRLSITESGSITTSANEADGGNIALQGNILFLDDGLVTTSVTGESGNGGDITIKDMNGNGVLVMQNGFIQANTAADQAFGGDIYIDVAAVIADACMDFLIGGEDQILYETGQQMNVIQAAAPGGENGEINITAPEVDVAGSLARMGAGFSSPARLATDPCTAGGDKTKNSLVRQGRGEIPASPEDLSTVVITEERLERMIKYEAKGKTND